MIYAEDKIKNMYIKNNKKLQQTFDSCHFILKYDYTSDKMLNKIDSLLENQKSSNKEFIDLDVEKPFYEYFFEILDEFDSDKIFNLMSAFYFKTEILKDKNKTIEDCSSRVDLDIDKQFVYSINAPDQEKDTSMLYASYAHELIHFPQLIRKKNYEYYEYSEVLSIFFEYLMYDKISHGKGNKILLNNRIKQLYSNKSDLENDLYYAQNNHVLNLPRDTFSLLLANYISYYDGLEYVLHLIDYYHDNKKKISDLVYRVLFDESSMKKEAEKLRIDTSSHSRILKII